MEWYLMDICVLPNTKFVPEITDCAPDRLVFLIGSGVSKSPPSGLPLGGELKDGILARLEDVGLVDTCNERYGPCA